MNTFNFETKYVVWGNNTLWANWEHPTETKLREFLNLRPGWHYGTGAPATEKNYQIATALHRLAQSLSLIKTNAFPGEDGEIALTIKLGPDSLEFVVEADGSITFSSESNDDTEEYLEGLNLQEAESILRNFRAKQTCDSLDSSKAVILTGMISDLTKWPSGITPNPMPMAPGGHPLSLLTAYETAAFPYVNISVNTIPFLSKKEKPSFGASRQTYFHMTSY